MSYRLHVPAHSVLLSLVEAPSVQHLMRRVGGEVLLSISKTDGKERQARQCGGSTRGGKQSGPSENHPQNNLYQNSFCQQILWRESPFRQKNLLMHFRAHINSTGALSPQPTNKRLETHTGQCYACLLRVLWSFFLCLDLFLHGV